MTAALAYGMDVKTLSAVVRHRSSGTTLNVYTHATESMERQAQHEHKRENSRGCGSFPACGISVVKGKEGKVWEIQSPVKVAKTK